MCVGGLGVCSWMDGQKGDLVSGIFEAAPECLEGLPLSIWREYRTKNCTRENLRVRNETLSQSIRNETPEQRVCQSGVRLRRRELEIQAQDAGCSVSSKMWVHNCRRAVWNQERKHGAVKTMTRGISIFGSYVEFSLSSCDSHISNTQECLKVPTSPSSVWSSWSVFVFSSFRPQLFGFYFYSFWYNLWNGHSAASEAEQRGPHL